MFIIGNFYARPLRCHTIWAVYAAKSTYTRRVRLKDIVKFSMPAHFLFQSMGAKSSVATIAVYFDYQQVAPGDVVSGKVFLSVVQPQVDCVSIGCRLLGQESVEITRGGGKNQSTRHYRDVRNFLDNQFCLQKIPSGSIASGQYEFPFQFSIPNGCPASMNVSHYRDHCSIVYMLEVWLDRPGMLRWDIRHKQMFSVFTNMPPLARTPVYIEPIALKAQFMCCGNRGDIIVGGASENGVLSPGETTSIQYAVQNNSTSNIKAIEISLVETVSFQARGHISNSIVPLFVARINARNCPPDLNLRASSGPVPSLDQSLRMMNEVLRSDTTKVPFVVPLEARSSYSGAIIQVTHQVKIKVITTFGTSNLEVARNVTMYNRGAQLQNATIIHDDQVAGFTPMPALPADWSPVVAQAVTVPPMKRQASVAHVELDEHTKVVYASAPISSSSSSADASLPSAPVGYGSAIEQLLQRVQGCFDTAGEVSRFLAQGHSADDFLPEHLFQLFSAAQDTFDQLRLADVLAANLTSISCDKLARAAAGAKDMSRREVVEKLLTVQGGQGLVDRQNAEVVYRQLTAFEAMTVEKYFK